MIHLQRSEPAPNQKTDLCAGGLCRRGSTVKNALMEKSILHARKILYTVHVCHHFTRLRKLAGLIIHIWMGIILDYISTVC